MSILLSKFWFRNLSISLLGTGKAWKVNVCLRLLNSLTPALAQKFGFSSLEAFKEEAQRKFSLVEQGVVQKPSTRLLLINVRSYRKQLTHTTDARTSAGNRRWLNAYRRLNATPRLWWPERSQVGDALLLIAQIIGFYSARIMTDFDYRQS